MAADSVLVTNLVLQIKGGMMAIFIFRYTFEWWVNLFLTIVFTDNQWDAFQLWVIHGGGAFQYLLKVSRNSTEISQCVPRHLAKTLTKHRTI